jgi:nucleotide-binding universal stress UspA family protein
MTDNEPYVILAAVDYSPSGDLALDRALSLATEKKAAIVHVVNVLPVYQSVPMTGSEAVAGGFIAPLPSVNDAAEHLRAYVQRQVETFRQAHGELSLVFLDQIVAHQRLDVPSEEIARLAGEIDADLVVLGTHGRRGLTRLLLGSVAEGVVRLAPCPVLVVRPKAAPLPSPEIEPACSVCVETRIRTNGAETWCEQHREHHGQRHVYHQSDRSSEETNMPLLIR